MPLPLPASGSQPLDDLAEVIGPAAARALAWAFRGQRLYVPKDPERNREIAAAIGPDPARRLCRVFGGTSVPMPFDTVLRWKVVTLANEGTLTRQQIARECGIREARVYAILDRARKGGDEEADSRQLPLL